MTKSIKVYEAIVKDTANTCQIVHIPAFSAKEVHMSFEGKGEVIRVEDVSKAYPIDVDGIVAALTATGLGSVECGIVRGVLSMLKCTGNSPANETADEAEALSE